MPPIDLAQAAQTATAMREFRVDRFILYPVHWQGYTNAASLKWKRVKFSAANKAKIPNDEFGVYTFVAEPGIASHPTCSYLLYVGKADRSSFRKRFESYLNSPTAWKARPHIAHMVKRWQGYLWFCYAPVTKKAVIQPLEHDLITAFLPPENRAWPASITKTMPLVFS